MSRVCTALFLILVLPLPAYADEWTGKVVGVTDGDTIRVLHEGKQVKIRRQGIDSPEKGQAFWHQGQAGGIGSGFRQACDG